MIKKNKNIEIKSDNIFENDTLNRREIIEDLSKLLITCNDPFVLSINASWGAGKTTFIKLWKEYLKKEHKINNIYFSAWEDDFSKEPLVSILGEIDDYINENYKPLPKVAEKFKLAKSFGVKVLKRGLPALIKSATSGLIDLENDLENAITAMTEDATKELIENYSIEKNITKKLQSSLNEVLEEMDSEKPFIIFIDELDRCRPLYAIELLERIKHIFGIPKLIFVLSIDKTQLAESIKSQYGDIDTDNYLRRFIDLEYNLANPTIDNFCDVLYKKFDLENLIKSKEITHNFEALDMIKQLAIILNLSPRQIEQTFTKLNIIIKTMRKRLYPIHLNVFAFFEILRTHDSNSYFQLVEKKENIELFLNDIKDLKVTDLAFIEALIDATIKSPEEMLEIFKALEETLEKAEKSENPDTVKIRYLRNKIYWTNPNSGNFKRYPITSLVGNVIKKIEFVEKFSFD